MAIALTDFIGLCGFRPITEMADFVQSEHFMFLVYILSPILYDHVVKYSAITFKEITILQNTGMV